MFTGIIEAVGTIGDIDNYGDDSRLLIDPGGLDLGDMTTGASLAVNGVCLSLVSHHEQGVAVDVSTETLRCTTLAALHSGSTVNLERPLRLSDRLGGHLVSGHVDGVGTVVGCEPAGESLCLRIQAPHELARYLAAKGSVCVDGVSLTVNTVEGAEFSVNLIPHTRSVTTLGSLGRGSQVNLEVDMIARYLERLIAGRSDWR